MFGGAGRPGKYPSAEFVGELEERELEDMIPGKAPAALAFRDSHHMVARLFAMGMRPGAVAESVGYSLQRVSVLHNDPAFKELIEHYRALVTGEYIDHADEYFRTVTGNRIKSARLISDKLDTIDDPSDVSFRELVTIHADSADRTGYPKRSVAVNVNVDFAAKLDQAIQRSAKFKPQVIDVVPVRPPAEARGVESDVSSTTSLSPSVLVMKRRS